MKIYLLIAFHFIQYFSCYGTWIRNTGGAIKVPHSILELYDIQNKVPQEGLFVTVANIVSGWEPRNRTNGGYVNLLAYLKENNVVKFYVNNVFPIQGVSETICVGQKNSMCNQLYDVIRGEKHKKEILKFIPIIYEYCSEILACDAIVSNTSLYDILPEIAGLEEENILEAVHCARQNDIDTLSRLCGDEFDDINEYKNYLESFEYSNIIEDIYNLNNIRQFIETTYRIDYGITNICIANSMAINIRELIASGYQKIADTIFQEFMSSVQEYFVYFDYYINMQCLEENPMEFMKNIESSRDFYFMNLRQLVHTEYLLAYDLDYLNTPITTSQCFISYYAMCNNCEMLWSKIANNINNSGICKCKYMHNSSEEEIKDFTFSVLVGNIKPYKDSFERDANEEQNLKKMLVNKGMLFH